MKYKGDAYKLDQKAAREMAKGVINQQLSLPASTRKHDHQKIVNRLMTKKGYVFGVRVDSREHNLIKHRYKKYIREQATS